MSSVSIQASLEKAELETVLQSGIFVRAPNLASFLKYVCEKYFEGGEAENVKEYCIAVEALNRPASFDPKQDSIVRVEAHRLRKRLAAYYQREGSSHLIHIEIPNGQYSPRFVQKTQQPPIKQEDPPVVAIFSPTEIVDDRKELVVEKTELVPPAATRRWPISYTAGIALVISVAGIFGFAETRAHRDSGVGKGIETWQGSSAEPVPGEFRFLAGYHGSPFADRQGRMWQPDAYFKGGVSVPLPENAELEGLPDPKFAKSRREGTFSYAIPARQGTYEIHLHFIGAPHGDRYDPASLTWFRIAVNGKIVMDSFDPISEAGGFDRLHTRVIRDVTPEKDGKIHLGFEKLASNAFVNAVEVLSSEPGRVRPVRIVAAKSSVVDSAGSVWVADEDAIGGFLIQRNDSIQDERLRMLYTGEHYGNFSYRIPMPPGKYRVKLYFAETYFGSKLPYASGETGARLFNVFANGVALLRDFDVAKEAGGPNRATFKVFENIEPNAQGNIVLEFVPIRNYAEVNAIEVTQMN